MSAPGSGKRVLLTGASGFIAAHVLGILLDQGYTVICTVRNDAKKQDVLSAHPSRTAQLEFAIVPDIARENAFDDAVRAAASAPLFGILHTASPFHHNSQDMLRDMLEPAVQGTLNILRAAKAYAPGVKRVVITSSFAAVRDTSQGLHPGKVYTEDDWNPITWEQSQEDAGKAYLGSKKFAEKAAWDFIESDKPSFDIATINPPMVYGPIINAQTLASINTSNGVLWRLISGSLKDVPPTGPHLWVDVRDVAQAHVAALTAPGASNKRLLVVSDEIYSNQMAADFLRKRFPDLKDRVPVGKPGTGLGTTEYLTADNSRSKGVLGLTYTGFEKTCEDTIRSLLELEKKEKAA